MNLNINTFLGLVCLGASMLIMIGVLCHHAYTEYHTSKNN